MTYRIASNKYKTKFWYINPPKTGTQAVREFIERELPKSALIEHPSFRWHQTIEEIVHDKTLALFNRSQDCFFTTVRNPWARALSYFHYQKRRIEERLEAYSSEEAASRYVKANPLHVFDYKNKRAEVQMAEQYETHFLSFEMFVLSLPNSYSDYVVESVSELDNWWPTRNKTAVDFHYHTIKDYVNSDVANKNLIFPLERVEVLEEWLSKAFDVPLDRCRLNQINVQGIGKTYRDHYSKEMADVIADIESYVIDLVGYEY